MPFRINTTIFQPLFRIKIKIIDPHIKSQNNFVKLDNYETNALSEFILVYKTHLVFVNVSILKKGYSFFLTANLNPSPCMLEISTLGSSLKYLRSFAM